MSVGISLVVLLMSNVRPMGIDVGYIIADVAFSLISAAVLSIIIRRLLISGSTSPLKAFACYAMLRIVAAVALIAGFMMISGKRGMEILPFVVLFFVFFILQDAIDAVYLVKVQKYLQKDG